MAVAESTAEPEVKKLGLLNQLIRFGLIGGVCALLDYGSYMTLLALEVPNWLARSLAFALGTTTSYVANRRLTFTGANTGNTKAKFGAFVLVYLVTFLVNIGTNQLLFLTLPRSTSATGRSCGGRCAGSSVRDSEPESTSYCCAGWSSGSSASPLPLVHAAGRRSAPPRRPAARPDPSRRAPAPPGGERPGGATETPSHRTVVPPAVGRGDRGGAQSAPRWLSAPSMKPMSSPFDLPPCEASLRSSELGTSPGS